MKPNVTSNAASVSNKAKVLGERVPDLPTLIQAKTDARIRSHASRFLEKAFGRSLAAIIVIIVLQGFHLWGFSLSEPFLHWLGAATIGEIAGVAAMIWRQK